MRIGLLYAVLAIIYASTHTQLPIKHTHTTTIYTSYMRIGSTHTHPQSSTRTRLPYTHPIYRNSLTHTHPSSARTRLCLPLSLSRTRSHAHVHTHVFPSSHTYAHTTHTCNRKEFCCPRERSCVICVQICMRTRFTQICKDTYIHR